MSEYTLCNNSQCPLNEGCMRYKKYFALVMGQSGVIREQQMFIKTFEPFDQYICKYKIDKDGN